MMILRIISGILLLIAGILMFFYNKKESKKEGPLSGPIQKSIDYSGYLFVILLISIGIGLIISCFFLKEKKREVINDPTHQIIIRPD